MKIVFNKGHVFSKKHDKIPSLYDGFVHTYDWMSGMAKKIIADSIFNEVIYTLTVDVMPCGEYKKEVDGVKFRFLTVKDLNAELSDCDVFFKRANPEMVFQKHNYISVFYGASSEVMPTHRDSWDYILSSLNIYNNVNNKRGDYYSWVKGISEDFWHPISIEKKYDFICVGRVSKDLRFTKRLANKFPEKTFLLIGWPGDPLPGYSNIESVGRKSPLQIKKYLSQSRWGIISTQNGLEGYPMQTQLEYSMCGLPYVYDKNLFIVDPYYTNKNTAINNDDFIFNEWKRMSELTLNYSRSHFTSEQSVDSLLKIIGRRK